MVTADPTCWAKKPPDALNVFTEVTVWTLIATCNLKSLKTVDPSTRTLAVMQFSITEVPKVRVDAPLLTK